MTSVECKAITKTGERCKRNATIDGFCKQHFDAIASDNKTETDLIPDVTRNVLSSYIEYDELKNLVNEISDLKIHPDRVQEIKTDNEDGSYTVETKIDGKLRKIEKYNSDGIKIKEENFNSKGTKNGPQYSLRTGWWFSGNIEYEHYKNT